jgi:hypothetical protein
VATKRLVWDGGELVVTGADDKIRKVSTALAKGGAFSGRDLTFEFRRNPDDPDDEDIPDDDGPVRFHHVRAGRRRTRNEVREALQLPEGTDWAEVLAALHKVKLKG